MFTSACAFVSTLRGLQHALQRNTVALPSNLQPENTFPAFVELSVLLFCAEWQILCAVWTTPTSQTFIFFLHLPLRLSGNVRYACVYTFIYPSVFSPQLFTCICVSHCVLSCVWDIWCQLSHPSRSGPIIRDNNNNSLKPRAGTVELIGSSN